MKKRKKDHNGYKMPNFTSVVFSLKKASKKVKTYNLNIVDSTLHVLGLLITEEDIELLEMLGPGDKLQDIMAYAEQAMIRIDGTVQKITKIEKGKYRNCHRIAIHSNDIIESCIPPDSPLHR